MRFVIFIGCMLIADAINPTLYENNVAVLTAVTWILVISAVMDIMEFMRGFSSKRVKVDKVKDHTNIGRDI